LRKNGNIEYYLRNVIYFYWYFMILKWVIVISYVKCYNFKMFINHFKRIISIKPYYDISYIILLSLNLIIGKCLILKLTSENEFFWTKMLHIVCIC
jgi:hypothetical protein